MRLGMLAGITRSRRSDKMPCHFASSRSITNRLEVAKMNDQTAITADQAMLEEGNVTMQTARGEVMRLSGVENEASGRGASRNVERGT